MRTGCVRTGLRQPNLRLPVNSHMAYTLGLPRAQPAERRPGATRPRSDPPAERPALRSDPRAERPALRSDPPAERPARRASARRASGASHYTLPLGKEL